MKSMDNKEGAKLLLNSGLLFEINRRVLHPLGLALSVHCDEITEEPTGVFGVMRTEDPEGLCFDEAQFLEATRLFDEYMQKEGTHRLAIRLAALDFLIQEKYHPLP